MPLLPHITIYLFENAGGALEFRRVLGIPGAGQMVKIIVNNSSHFPPFALSTSAGNAAMSASYHMVIFSWASQRSATIFPATPHVLTRIGMITVDKPSQCGVS